MYNIICQIETFLRGMWRFNWWAIAVSWVVFVGGTLLVFSLPNQYETSASFYVNNTSVMKPILNGITVQADIGAHAYVLSDSILSRTNMEEIIHSTGLSERLQSDEDLPGLVAYLQKSLVITSERENLYDVVFTDKDPEVAYQVLDLLLNRFLDKVLTGKMLDTEVTENFLEEQILIYEERLTKSEKLLAEFKKQNLERLPTTDSNYFQDLQSAQSKLDEARLALNQAVQRRNELQRQINGETPIVGLVGFSGPSPESTSATASQIAQISDQMNSDLLIYTENHPRIVSAKTAIAQLEKKLQLERSAAPTTPSVNSPSTRSNPVYQSVAIALKKSEIEVATHQASVNEYRRKVAALRNSLDGVTEVEAQLARLNRDYAINQTQYQELVKRLELARLSQKAELSDDSVNFQLVDPPVVPSTPIGPHRPLFISAVLLLSIVIGAGFALCLDQARPVFLTTHHLNRETSLPVYGAVTLKVSEERLRAERASLAVFVLLVTMMFGFYSVSVMKHEAGATLISSYLTK